VKTAGEDVVEEEPLPEPELVLGDGLQDYSDETPGIYNGGLSDELGEEAMGAEEV
jgi:hypothetical protein